VHERRCVRALRRLCATIAGWAKNDGEANSLCVKLQSGQIIAFDNEIDAQTGKAFTAEQAATLKRLAGRL
jgi:alpha-ketoglutarate-dependent taurine dioxygenase